MPAHDDAKFAGLGAESERSLSTGAAAYRAAAPYMAASSTLIGSVAVFTAIGYGLDRWLGHTVQWLLVIGAVFGIAVGFIAFFTRVLRADADAKRARSYDEKPGARARDVVARGDPLLKGIKCV